MSLARLQSRAPNGLDAPPVSVEIHLSGGLPSFTIVGLPEAAVRESRERVRSALINSGFDFPARRITANLAPADIPKQGGRFDLPIALGILAASGQIKPVATDLPGEYLGELGLGGELRSVTGVLPSVLAAKALNHTVMLPEANCAEASLVEGASLLATQSLIQAAAHLSGSVAITEKTGGQSSPQPQHQYAELDLGDVCGQSFGVRSLEIAAAGGHSLMMVGPPGCGKTMLAERLAGILPDMSPSEALATAAVYSVSHLGFDRRHWQRRPFRAPHHSASAAALVGGGPRVAPGEISLAHNGVLFLDELTEFSRHVLDQLREPLESGSITLARAERTVRYPSRFQWVSAMNPCACGYNGDRSGRCRCTSEQVRRYQARLSGPLIDRVDLHVRLQSVDPTALQADKPPSQSSADVKRRVHSARERQLARSGRINACLTQKELGRAAKLDSASQRFLEAAVRQLGLSLRGHYRILKVARTIADLEETETLGEEHLAEALQYRATDRLNPGSLN